MQNVLDTRYKTILTIQELKKVLGYNLDIKRFSLILFDNL